MKATLILTDGTSQEVVPANGKTFTLAELQAFVGGYIEIHHMPAARQVIVINEDGRAEHLPTNDKATIAAYHLHTCQRGVLGNALICDSDLIK